MTNSKKIKKNPNFKSGKDILNEVVEGIKEGLEDAKNQAWEKPWTEILKLSGLPKNATTGVRYRGFNIFQLWALADRLGYPINEWGTFLQFKNQDLKLKKGSVSGYVIKYGTFEKDIDEITNAEIRNSRLKEIEAGKTDDRSVTLPYVKSTPVFNVTQLEGYEEKYVSEKLSNEEQLTIAFAKAKEIEDLYGVKINRGFNRAYYMPAHDVIYMPAIGQFNSTEEYFSTLFHEQIHSTKLKNRLDRSYSSKKDTRRQEYAFEELVAELGACLLCAHCGISNVKIRANHTKYIASWIKLLTDDPDAFMRAASLAFDAMEYILNEVEENKHLVSKEDDYSPLPTHNVERKIA